MHGHAPERRVIERRDGQEEQMGGAGQDKPGASGLDNAAQIDDDHVGIDTLDNLVEVR
jgi:hypothetical protein